VKQLPDLIGFRFALHVLKVEKFRNVRINKDMMTAFNSRAPKSKGLCQPEKIAKPHIVRSREDSFEKSSRSHSMGNPSEEVG